MHKDLKLVFNKVVEILKEDSRCMGGWHYGSVGRGDFDIYSDYDPIFLVENKYFNDFANDVSKIISSACDELLIFWGEDFNDDHFKNYCTVVRMGNNLHQFDFFIVNHNFPEEWMCKQHLKGCTKDNIIFDRTGEVAKLLDRGLRTDNYTPDLIRAMDTYWFHLEMLIKYFKRKDIFKLIKNIDVLFHSHIDLLLSQYDTLDWGAWENKVKHCVPPEKQEHLKTYFTNADLNSLEIAVKKSMILFKRDAQEACDSKNIIYPDSISNQIISYFNQRMSTDEWD